MAKTIGISPGKFSGKCGTEVFYYWKHRQCVRAYVAHIAYPDTPKQRQEREWFVAMVRFASKASEAIRIGLRESADRARMSEGNYFVRQNKHCFNHEDGRMDVDYPSLVIAEGSAADVFFCRPRFEDNEIVEVPFEKNSRLLRPSGDDSVYLFFYNADLGESFLSAPALRRSKQLRVRLPQHWAACEVHIYGFVVDREKQASNSTYIGCGRLNYYEENGQYVQIDKDWKDFVDCAIRSNNTSSNIIPSKVVSAPSGDPAPAPPQPCGKEPPEVP